jgi:hypothetical protein
LQKHENHKIYDMSVKILETYFGVEEDEEEPMSDQPGGFTFNAAAAPQVTCLPPSLSLVWF